MTVAKSIPTFTADQTERFWNKVEVHHPAGCWQWTGAKSENGYGLVVSFLKQGLGKFYAHRVAYTFLIGEPDPSFHLDHLCRNPACVNPDHIQAVDPKTNIMRGVGIGVRNAQKTHCAQGHELTPDNLTGDKSRRRCKICSDRVQAVSRRKAVLNYVSRKK